MHYLHYKITVWINIFELVLNVKNNLIVTFKKYKKNWCQLKCTLWLRCGTPNSIKSEIKF